MGTGVSSMGDKGFTNTLKDQKVFRATTKHV